MYIVISHTLRFHMDEMFRNKVIDWLVGWLVGWLVD